jgi:protein-S-isoprenylcysteine O-methyltransferase Ste14
MLVKAITAVLVLPGVVIGIIPAIIIGYDPWRNAGHWSGYVVLLLGLGILFKCIRDFYVAGKGTLAPWAPPEQIVRIGFYRFVRNPMYVGIIISIGGLGISLGSPLLGAYLLLLMTVFHINLNFVEEPRLAKKFNAAWSLYAQKVPRWFPRFRSG